MTAMPGEPIYVRCCGCGHTVEHPCVGPRERSACERFNGARMTSDEWPKDATGQPWVGHPVEEPDAGINPKDLIGQSKVDLSLFPPAGLIHAAHAMMDGAVEYGPYNWRDKRVRAMVYSAAAKRHIEKWQDRQDIDPKSGAHHLGHAISCLGIVLDAEATGTLVDDRPPPGGAADLLDVLNEQILERRKSR